MKYSVIIWCLVVFTSCGIFQSRPDKTRPTSPSSRPSKPKVEPIPMPTPPVTDTTIREKVEEKPKIEPENGEKMSPSKDYRKEQYDFLLFLPVIPSEGEDVAELNQWNRRFLQYAAGFEKGLEEIEQGENFSYRFYVQDAGDWDAKIKSQSYFRNGVDVILGAVTKESLDQLSQYAADKKIAYISPWLPESPLYPSAYTLQMSPSITDYIVAIGNDAIQRFPNQPIFIVAPASDPNQLNLYNDIIEEQSWADRVTPLVLDDPKEEDFTLLFPEGDSSILLFGETQDQGFVHATLTQCSMVEEHQFFIYGMPNWTEFVILSGLFDKFPFYIASAKYLDREIRSRGFTSDFYKAYGAIPNEFAARGYDHARYIGRQLVTLGTQFPIQTVPLSEDFLFGPISFKGVAPDKQEEMLPVTQINQSIMILKYKEGSFYAEIEP